MLDKNARNKNEVKFETFEVYKKLVCKLQVFELFVLNIKKLKNNERHNHYQYLILAQRGITQMLMNTLINSI